MAEHSLAFLSMIIIFVIGYACITLEHIIKINKATVALMMAILCWSILFMSGHCTGHVGIECFLGNLAEISQIVFFLIGALAIVEIINAHQGFKVVSDYIKTNSIKKLLWIIGFFSFVLSGILDNLTTTVVMISLLSKLVSDRQQRLILGGAVVIAANAGGAWTPIGDVTTTMLWIGGQLSTLHMMPTLFVPSLVCMLVALFVLSFMVNGDIVESNINLVKESSKPHQKLVFFLGISALIFVPIFKLITGLPPLMGILFGVSALWMVTDWIHRHEEDREHLKVPAALTRIDLASTLFFLGILLSVAALSQADILSKLAVWLDSSVGNISIIATIIGLVSAVVDNVPLVAAAMEMYDLSVHPMDSKLWDLIAYCAGTGGSVLIIGSAAGVVFMGMEKVDFFWYIRKISFAALVGYLAGIGIYLLM